MLGFRALGFRVLGFTVWGLGFRVWGLGFGVQGLGFRVWVGTRVLGFRRRLCRAPLGFFLQII